MNVAQHLYNSLQLEFDKRRSTQCLIRPWSPAALSAAINYMYLACSLVLPFKDSLRKSHSGADCAMLAVVSFV